MSAPLPSRVSRRLSKLSNAVQRTVIGLRSGRTGSAFVSEADNVELLESRRLFTTLVGGDVFEYTTSDPANPENRVTERIILRGNIVAELVGGSLVTPTSSNSAVAISDVPGRFYASTLGRTGNYLGGVGGGTGVQPVVLNGSTGLSITDGTGLNSVPYDAERDPLIGGFNVKATAVTTQGTVYGFNVLRTTAGGTAAETAVIQLVQVSTDGTTGTVVATLNSRISNATLNSNFVNANGVTDITAAAYNPIDGNIYFVVRGGSEGTNLGSTNNPFDTQQLFRVNPNAGSTAAVLASVTAVSGSFQRNDATDTNVTALAFEENNDVATLYGFIVHPNDNQTGIFQVNLGNTNIINNVRRVTNRGQFLNAITGLAFVNDDTGTAATQIYAVETGSTIQPILNETLVLADDEIGPQVLLVSLTSGAAQALGSLPGPNASAGDRGNDLQSLVYNSAIRNPFTGELGVLMSIDNTTFEVVYVDARNRFASTNAFTLFISQADANAEIIVGRVDTDDPDDATDDAITARPMQPFTGSAGVLRVVNGAGQQINVTSPTGIGGVFLGLKTFGNTNPDLNNIPIVAGSLAASLGVAPAGGLAAGVVTSESLLASLSGQASLNDRLIGSTVSNVTALAVTVAGNVYAIDADGRAADGSVITFDQLVQLNPSTGKVVGSPLNIRLANGNNAGLSRGMTAVPTNQGDQLLAIFIQQFSSSGSNSGSGTGTASTLGDAFDFGSNVPISFSLSSTGLTGFILATQGDVRYLYRFDRTSLTDTDITFTSLGRIVDANSNMIGAAQALGLNNAGQLYTVGYNKENPNPTQSTGGQTVNIDDIDPLDLTYASDGSIYFIGLSGGSVVVREIQRDLTTGSVTGLGAANVITLGGSSVFNLSDLTPDPTNGGGLIGVGQSSGSFLPSQSQGTITDSNAQSDFSYRGMTNLGTDQYYAIVTNGSTLELRRIGTSNNSTLPGGLTSIPSSPRTGVGAGRGVDIRIDVNTANTTGPTTAVLGINSVTTRPGDANGLWAVGYSANALLPTDTVIGNLGTASVNQVSGAGFDLTFNFIDDQTTPYTLGGISYTYTGYFFATRNTSTGGLLTAGGPSYSVATVGQASPATPFAAIPQTGGTAAAEQQFAGLTTLANMIADTRALATAGTGYLTVGFNIDSPVPSAPLPGNLGIFAGVDPQAGDTNLRGLALAEATGGTGAQDGYAVYFNGIGFDIYRMVRNTTTGAVQPMTRISTGDGLRDPSNINSTTNQPELIQFIYTIFRDQTAPGRYYVVGSSNPQVDPNTGDSTEMSLYPLTITTTSVTVGTPVPLTSNGDPVAGTVIKAGAVNSAGQVFIVVDGDGSGLGIDDSSAENSALFQVDPTTGNMDFFGFVGVANYGSAAPTGATPVWNVANSDIRAMQFVPDSDGREKLLLLDKGTAGTLLAEMDMSVTPTKTTPPLFALGGVDANMAGITGTTVAAVALQVSLPGTISTAFTTYQVDEYGRGYSINPGASPANPDTLWVSANELYLQETGGTDPDNDNWTGESIRIGTLVNPDGTAFLDSITTMATDLLGQRAVAVARNLLRSSLRPDNTLFDVDRLVTFAIPGGVNNPTVNNNTGGNQTTITVTPVRRSTSPNDTGEITIDGNPTSVTKGATSNIVGLGFGLDGSLIALNRDPSTFESSLVAIQLDATASPTAALTGNPTFNTQALTDPDDTTGFTADPRGLATDSFGRFYTIDGTTIGTGTTRLLVSPNTVSLFRIDKSTGVATRWVDLADAGQVQQTPVLSQFGGIAFQDSNTVFLVQRDIRSGNLTFDNLGRIIGVDRLVSFDIPLTAAAPGASPTAFSRYNTETGGAIQVGNTAVPPAASNGVPTTITHMAFSAGGQLVGLDSRTNRQVLINLDLSTQDSVSPTNSIYISGTGSTAGFVGFTRLVGGTAFATIDTGTSPDRLLISTGTVSLIGFNPATGATTNRGAITVNGQPFPQDVTVVALATQPGTGLIYAVVRVPATDSTAARDVLYTINAATGAASLVGNGDGTIRRNRDASGNLLAPSQVTRIVSIEFNDQGRLLAINDPSDSANDRYLMVIDITDPSQSRTVRGSTGGAISDSIVGIASDALDDGTNVPAEASDDTDVGGRLYALDASNSLAAVLRVTPTQLYLYSGTSISYTPDGGGAVETAAAFTAVGPIASTSGTPVLDSITSLTFSPPGAPQGEVLYGVRTSLDGTNQLVTISTTLSGGFIGITGGVPIVVTSAAQVTGGPTVTAITTPQAAFISAMVGLPDGTIRAVDTSQGTARLIDISPATPATAIARTNPGALDATAIGLDYIVNGSTFTYFTLALDSTNSGQIFFQDGIGIIDTGNTGGSVGGGSGVIVSAPVLGSIDPTTGIFTPIGGSPTSPGRLPSSVTDVKAMAYNRVTSQLFIVDQNNVLRILNASTAAITSTIGVIRDAVSGATLNIGSIAFDASGRLIAHDVTNGRAVDVSTTTAVAGGVIATSRGSLPSTVGAIAYDLTPGANRFLAVDNSTGLNSLTTGDNGVSVGASLSSQLLQFNSTVTTSVQDIGKVLIGGTVAGSISFSGSVGTFYAGWILTGTIGGLAGIVRTPTPGNFSVAGNLNELLTVGPLGGFGVSSSVTYNTGTDIRVNGRIGAVHSASDIVGTVRALNNRVASTLGSVIEEQELRAYFGTTPLATAQGEAFASGFVRNDAFFNDDFDSAQPLHAGSNPDGSSSGFITVSGNLENNNNSNDRENIDYYSVAMMAGQSIEIQLSSADDLSFGVHDPNNRLIFSNRSLGSFVDTAGVYRFTAPRPGEYRIAIGQSTDANFNGNPTSITFGLLPYALTVSGLGDLTVGAVVAEGTILDNAATASTLVLDASRIYAASGDIGAVRATNMFSNGSSTTSNTVRAGGNIRSIDSGAIGLSNNNAISLNSGISYSAGGSVGLIRSRTGVLLINQNVTPPSSNTGTVANFNPEITRVRGNIQMIDAATTFVGNVFADGGLGNLVAGDMAVAAVSYINVNADNSGNDGVIDMIDVTGQMGTLTAGGPIIYTNEGGNVRYMRAGSFFRDIAFGSGTEQAITLDPGDSLNFKDDSGSTINVSIDKRTLVPNPDFNAADPTSQRYLNAPQIAYNSYPIRSGGAVLMLLQVTNLGHTTTIEPGAPQLKIQSSGPSGNAEISFLQLLGTDNAVTADATTGSFAQTGSTTATPSYNVEIGGSARVDVGGVNILNSTGTALGNVTSFVNRTSGELLDFSASSVGTLDFRGSIGIARKSATGTDVTTATGTVADIYPFDGNPFLVQPGDIINLISGEAIGNVRAGNIDRVVANDGGSDNGAVFEGIGGPIVAEGSATIPDGVINRVRIGEGIATAGQGRIGGGAVIAEGPIGIVEGSGDVRGIIASQTNIGTVSIGGNGSLINAQVTVYGVPANQTATPYNPLVPIDNNALIVADFEEANGGTVKNRTYELGSLSVAGGIIGSFFNVYDVNRVSVDGFGIINSSFRSAGGGRLESMSAGGYGLRDVSVDGYSFVGSITARGNGSQLSTQSVTPSVRRSEFETIDSVTGYPISSATDIHSYLTTSAATPIIDGVTNTGIIEDIVANGNGSLGTISAWRIQGSAPGTVNSELNFAQSIGTITTKNIINGLTVRTGRLTNFTPANDVLALDLTVSGLLTKFQINGSLASNSRVSVTGPNAGVKNFTVKGNFDGSLSVSGRVTNITVGGNLTNGTININPAGGRGMALSKLTVGGSLLGASLLVNGDVGTIQVAGSFGSSGDTLTINGNLGTLKVGTNKRVSGKVLASNLNVSGAIKLIDVSGRITGSVTAAGSIRSIKVQSDGDANRTLIAGNITSTTSDINTISVTNGDIGGDITAFNRLQSISIKSGSVNAGADLQTTAGSVGKVTVKGGNFLGNIQSGNPSTSGLRGIDLLQVDGQIGDGTNESKIQASSIKTIKVGRDVFSKSTIESSGPINSLTIAGALQAGATVKATAIGRQKIGAVNGDIIFT